MKQIYSILLMALLVCGCQEKTADKITILHTNDTHSHIEPEKNRGGGLANRAAMIEHEKELAGAKNTLLLDCGDFSQGSLYYNVFKGAFEIDAMNALGYDAGTLGNHEFDFGLEDLAQLVKRANFPIVCANLDFTGTVCEGVIPPFVTTECGGIKVGIFGLSPKLEGLVLKEHYQGVKYRSPIEAAQESADTLRKEGCTIVICLSHLGWNIPGTINDQQLAIETSGIDIILGGHSHDLFEEPIRYKNKEGKEVVIQQAGKYGRNIGKIVVELEEKPV